MKEVTVNVYEFNELPEHVQEKLKESTYRSLLDDRFEVFNEWAPEYLSNEYDIDANVYYSLSYSQGDGIHFVTDNFFTPAVASLLITTFNNSPLYDVLIRHLLDDSDFTVTCRPLFNRYEYASRSDVRTPDFDELDLSDFPERGDLEPAYRNVVSALQDLYMEICSQLETSGYGCYDISDEEVIEACSQYYYYPDGRFYSEKED